MQHDEERLASACFWSLCSLGLCLAPHSSTPLHMVTQRLQPGSILSPALDNGRHKERDTHITENCSKTGCCTLKDHMDACKQLEEIKETEG